LRRHVPPVLALALVLGAPGPAVTLDLDLYAQLLARHTREVDDVALVRVDYAGLQTSRDWRRLVASLDDVDTESLAGDAKLAFWINAYNVLAIDVVVRSYPVKGIKEIGSLLRPVWKKTAGQVDGREISLDEIEHGILRPMGDPRIHGAIVCASLSCPPLLREPYRAERLDAQLETSLRRWLADERKGLRVEAARERLHLSRIFDWFEEDFEPAGGVLAFVARYAPEEEAAWIRAHGADARIRYLEYDWSLNDLATR
jgi:hypothetical protein